MVGSSVGAAVVRAFGFKWKSADATVVVSSSASSLRDKTRNNMASSSLGCRLGSPSMTLLLCCNNSSNGSIAVVVVVVIVDGWWDCGDGGVIVVLLWLEMEGFFGSIPSSILCSIVPCTMASISVTTSISDDTECGLISFSSILISTEFCDVVVSNGNDCNMDVVVVVVVVGGANVDS